MEWLISRVIWLVTLLLEFRIVQVIVLMPVVAMCSLCRWCLGYRRDTSEDWKRQLVKNAYGEYVESEIEAKVNAIPQEELDAKIKEALGIPHGEPYPIRMGFCYKYWLAKGDILMKDYGIVWHSPAECNPSIRYD